VLLWPAREQVDVFVWYRAAPEHRRRVEQGALGLIDQVEARCGIRGRLLVRCGTEVTWMEHFCVAEAPEPFEAALSDAARAWSPELPERHTERFETWAAARDRSD
jgi:hypothetical protein